MKSCVELSEELVKLARLSAAAEGRSVSEQIEYWARLGKAAEENPDLPANFIKATFHGMAEANKGYVGEYKLDL